MPPLLTLKNPQMTLMVAVEGCLPRVDYNRRGKPLFWNIFGQNGEKDNNDDTNTNYDKEALERSHWTTFDWIWKHKYAYELQNVTTKDGYQLQMQRLPKPGHRPVLLVHGLLTSSLSWVLKGPKQSLAFVLYDHDYDVWLANMRGSQFGQNHTHLNTSETEFWNFSFHEMGEYDLPAFIDHIRVQTSFHQVLLIGHSQVAFNAVLVMCTLKPEYNERILFMHALAPIVELRNSVTFANEDMKRLTKFIKRKFKAQKFEFFSNGELRAKCLSSTTDERRECRNFLKIYTGEQQFTRSLEPILFGQLLQGGSIKELQHLIQIWKSGDFASFDYDVEQNLQFYNSVNPNRYDLRRVTVPIILHFGDTDAIATPAGVHRIYARLLNSVLGVYRVTATKFSHLDFLCANDVKTLVNDKLIDLMEKYFTGKLRYVIE